MTGVTVFLKELYAIKKNKFAVEKGIRVARDQTINRDVTAMSKVSARRNSSTKLSLKHL
jgi:hypothetical protein